MNTNNIKSFAKQARLLLLEGIHQRLLYWGFDKKGQNKESLNKTSGGFIFRGQVFSDAAIPDKWNKLKHKIKNATSLQDIAEEAAYTWFNRLMAIQILERNQYIEPVLSYASEQALPQILMDAKLGNLRLSATSKQKLLLEYLKEDKENEALSMLLIDFCNRQPLLRDIFGRIDDYTELLIPMDLLKNKGLIQLLHEDLIPAESYKEVELIGWLYQFYISDKKDEVFAGFKNNKKARAEDIPAATQIFTPKWIVKYMVENTVGKIYLDFEPTSSLKEEMKYLVQNDSDKDNKAIISDITELSLIDPAAGSGHILVTGFDLLFRMYREQGYTAKQAVEHILTQNIFGLDIDDRAMQLARFAVLLKAAQYHPEILSPKSSTIIPNIYSFPEATYFTDDEIKSFLGLEGQVHLPALKEALNLLQKGKNIGSALKIKLSKESLQYIVNKKKEWQHKEQAQNLDILQAALWMKIKPFLPVLIILSSQFKAVVANPPYMGQKSMNGELKDYVNALYPITKSDLCTVFIEVMPHYAAEKGKYGFIVPPSWMFLSSFDKLREYVLTNQTIDSLLHLSRGIFGADFGSMCTVITNCTPTVESIGTYYRLVERTFQEFYQGHLEELFLIAKNNSSFRYDFKTYSKEEPNFKHSEKGFKLIYPNIPQSNFSKIPGSPIAYWVSERVVEIFENSSAIKDFGKGVKGLDTGKDAEFLKLWWEPDFSKTSHINTKNPKWLPYHKGGNFRKWYGNKDYFVNWDNNGLEIKAFAGAYARNQNLYFQNGLEWSRISSSRIGVRYMTSSIFGGGSQAAFLNDSKMDYYILALLNTDFVYELLKILNPTLVYQGGDINRIPVKIDDSNFDTVSSISLNQIQISRKDWDSRETSWDFEKSTLLGISNQGLGISKDQGLGIRDESSLSIVPNLTSLKNAYERWQAQVTQDFFQLHANEEELNRIFIDIYGLQEELTPEVALKDITILQEELDRNILEVDEAELREKGLGISRIDKGLPLVPEGYTLPIKKDEVLSQFLSYLVGIMMGRYRLDKPGLSIAHPNPSEEEINSYVVIRDKGLGADTQEAIFKYICNEYQEFSRSTGLAKIHGDSDRNFQYAEWIKQVAEQLVTDPKSLVPIEIDEDAILPIMGKDCSFPDDVLVRTKEIIHAIWGEDTLTENINFIHDALGMDLHKWFTEKFWGYHTSMYKKKPIYWLFSSNPKKPQKAAFKVLVYMHRMDKFTVQKIQRNYLHPHQEYIRTEIDRLKSQESALNRDEQKRLELLYQWEVECRDYNEVLKELANLQITFDLDDGVSVNYEKFEGAVAVI